MTQAKKLTEVEFRDVMEQAKADVRFVLEDVVGLLQKLTIIETGVLGEAEEEPRRRARVG